MNSDDTNARQEAITILGSRVDDKTIAYTLVHIALCSKHKFSRSAAVNKLAGKTDALNVVARNSEYDDTREYAKSLMPKTEEK